MERMWEAPTEAIAATKHYRRAAPKPAPTATTEAAKDAKDEEAAAATRIQAMHRGRKSRQSRPAAATGAKTVVEADLIVEEVDKVVAGVMEGVSSEVLSVLPFSEPWEVFRQLDVDGDGSLEYDQLFEFVAGMDENVANELMSMLDTNQDGKIDFQEFQAGWGSLFGADRPPSSVADVREVVMERSGKLADLSLAEEEAAATRIQAIQRGRKTRAARPKQRRPPPSLEPVSLHKHTSRNTSVYRKISEAIKDGADEEFAYSLEDVHDAFAGVDGEQSGEVDATQFEKAMARLDLGLGATQLREIFALTDNDGSGKIVYAEFAAELCSESTPGVRRKKTVTESPWGVSEPNPFLASGPLNASQKLGSTLPRNARSLDGAGSDGGTPTEAETRAATTLQAVQRGRVARSPRKVAARKVAREERRAAVRIQATVRGRKSRQVTARQHGGRAAKPAATRTRAGPRAGPGASDKEKQSPRSKVEATAEQIAEQDAAAFERIAHSKTAKQSPMAQMLAKQIREGQRKAEETAARGGKRGGRGGRGRGRGRASAGRGARGNDGLNRREIKPFGDVTSRPEQRLAAKRRRRPQEKQDVVEQVVGELVSAALGDAVRTVVQDSRQRRDEARAIKAVLLGRDHGERRQRGRRASKKGVVAAVGRPLYRVAEREAAEQSASATSLASLAAASQDRSSIGSRGRFIEENARQRRRDASQAHTSGPRRVAIRAVGGGGGAGPRVLPKHLPALPAGAPAVQGAA